MPFHLPTGALHVAAHLALGAVGGQHRAGVHARQQALKNFNLPQLGLLRGCKCVKEAHVKRICPVPRLQGAMQDLRRKPISLEPVRTSCLFMERTQAPCKVIRTPGFSPSVNLMWFEWMRFDADVIKCDPSMFRPLPSERCIKSRAEPHLEDAHTLSFFLVFRPPPFQSAVDEDVLGLGQRAVNTVVRDAPLDHFQGGRSVFCRRQAAVPCAARWFHNVLLQNCSMAPNPNNAKSRRTGSSGSTSRRAAVSNSTAFQSFCFRSSSPSFRPTLPVCTSKGTIN